MATQPMTPPNPADNNPSNPASDVVQPATEVQQTKTEAPKENSTSVFMNSEPMREEQVQNAVKFLLHPKVRGSPVIYRRSFLERKGLTKEEIDEAFRRVPDPSPTASNTHPAISDQGGQLKSSSNIQSQVPVQNVQPIAVVPTGAISKAGMFSRFHWSHALLATGLLALSGAGTAIYVKKSIIPRLKSWIRKVMLEDEEEESLVKEKKSKPTLAEEAAAAAKAASAAAADVAQASQEMLISKTEEKRCFEELISLLHVQVREMKLMSNSMQKLEGQSNSLGKTYLVEHEDRELAITSSKVNQQSYANGKPNSDLRSGKSLSLPVSVKTSTGPPHPKSYMENMAMVERGERPPNIREINDQPPNPDRPVSNSHLAPRPKPWEAGQAQNGSATYLQSQVIGDDYESHSGSINQLNSNSSVPWWQRKNVRITEIETEDEQKTGSYNGLTNERPVQRSWVPPQPPPVAMPEAAAAIRQPKKSSFQKEQLTDDQLLSSSTDPADDLQRITKISEPGGVVEANSGNSELNTSEIHKEENSYLEA